jgi:hypothetical protein
MKRLITLGVGAAIGYLLGSREGRQNLDKFAKNAQKLWNDPKTQEQVHKAASTVKEKAPGVADKATGLADKAADSIRDRAPGVADKASAAAHAVADKATAATQDLADRAGTTSQQSDGGKHASAGVRGVIGYRPAGWASHPRPVPARRWQRAGPLLSVPPLDQQEKTPVPAQGTGVFSSFGTSARGCGLSASGVRVPQRPGAPAGSGAPSTSGRPAAPAACRPPWGPG